MKVLYPLLFILISHSFGQEYNEYRPMGELKLKGNLMDGKWDGEFIESEEPYKLL